jgi:hypothetical protein
MSWDADEATAFDLYYDPTIGEHVGHGPIGLIVPAWYFAPQRPEVAEAGWKMAATINGVVGAGPVSGLDDPEGATMLLQIAGEFAEASMKKRIWDAAEDHIEPTWNHDTGEFTLGFKLGEPHPRGQLNARAMAGWVCTKGAWARLFNEPNLEKFNEPTVIDVDFPRVALSEARWDGDALHLAANPQNDRVSGTTTTMRVTNLDSIEGWVMTRPGGETISLVGEDDHLSVELVVDNRPSVLRRV